MEIDSRHAPVNRITHDRLAMGMISGAAWGVIALVLGHQAIRTEIWGGVIASPFIGVIVAMVFRGTWATPVGRLLHALLSLYFAACLFGIAIGLTTILRAHHPHPNSLSVVFARIQGVLWGLTFTGYVVFLWPLALLNHNILRRIAGGPGAATVAGIVLLLGIAPAHQQLAAQDSRPESRPAESRRASRSVLRETVLRKLDVDGVAREAMFQLPWKRRSGPSPVVFAFHGHGGSARQAQRSFGIDDLWPEALVVYPEGLPTPSARIDPEGRFRGWQNFPGHQKDRDFKFFDLLLEAVKSEYRIDEDRVYAMGHSNGGAFTYLLWAKRPDVFAAFAPSAASSWSIFRLQPKPAMHVAGEKDQLVDFVRQKQTMVVVRSINGCTLGHQTWAPGCELYPSTKGAPFVSFIHPGGHEYPSGATALIVRFFREQVRRSKSEPASRKSE